MGPLIQSNSPAKLDHRRPGDNGVDVEPLPMKPTAPRQGRNVTLNNQAASSTATNKPGPTVTNQLHGLSAECACVCVCCGTTERGLLLTPVRMSGDKTNAFSRGIEPPDHQIKSLCARVGACVPPHISQWTPALLHNYEWVRVCTHIL